MKSLKIVLAIIVFPFLLSCHKEGECYSCDVETDSFVKENQKLLLQSDVTTLASYTKETQRAAYRSFDREKKASLWKEKYTVILRNINNNFSNEELGEIKKLYDFISPETIEDVDTIREFVRNWILSTQEKYLWDVDRYRFLLFSLDPDETNYLSNTGKTAAVMQNWCECNDINGGVILDDCDDAEPNCNVTGNCRATESGCGNLWAERCNGVCQSGGGSEKNNQG